MLGVASSFLVFFLLSAQTDCSDLSSMQLDRFDSASLFRQQDWYAPQGLSNSG
jgi:hypothetical protein